MTLTHHRTPVWVVQGRPKPPQGYSERFDYAYKHGRPRVYKTVGDEWYVAGPIPRDVKRYYPTWREAIDVALNSAAGS